MANKLSPLITAIRVSVRHLNPSNPLHVFIYASLLILSMGVVWLLIEANTKVELIQIDENEAKWLAQQIKDYEYTFVYGCMFIEKVRVRVDNGLLLKGQHENSLEYLYNQGRNALLTAHKYELKFHPLGFPVWLSVDWEKSVIDDECFYSIEEFEIIVQKKV